MAKDSIIKNEQVTYLISSKKVTYLIFFLNVILLVLSKLNKQICPIKMLDFVNKTPHYQKNL